MAPARSRLLWRRVRDAVALDRQLLTTRQLPPAERGRLLVERYVAIARNRRSLRFLGHVFHYDNRLLPALLPAYLEEIHRLDAVVGLSDQPSVIDIGANVGQFAGTMSWMLPGARIWSFEPNPAAFVHLTANAEQTPGWTVVPFGIAEVGEPTEFWYVPGKSGQGSVHRENAAAGLLKTDVQTTTVDLRPLDRDTADDLGIPEVVDLVKIDVEGAEESALRGIRDLRWRYLAIEASVGREGGLTLAEIVDLVAELRGVAPTVVWAGDVPAGASTQDAILRLEQP